EWSLLLQVARGQIRCRPLLHRIHPAAVEATRQVESRAASGAYRTGLKRVECMMAVAAFPVIAQRGFGLASGTGEALATGEPCNRQQCPRLLQPAPAIQQGEGSYGAEPNRLAPNRYPNEADHSDKPKRGGDHETAGAAKNKPEQRSQDLPTVQRIDRENVEGEQGNVNE